MVVSFLAKQNFGNQKLIISFLILIFFNSCIFKNNSDNKAINNTIVKPILKSKKPEAIINHWVDTVPPSKISQTIERSFKFNLDTASYLLKEISVYSKNKKTQYIIANKEISELKFQLIDWNFDGYRDLSFISNCGSGGCAYWIWIYSPKTDRFIYNKRLSEVLGLEQDSLSQYIIFHFRYGYQEEYWDSLKYVNNKLKFEKGLHVECWIDSSGKFWAKNTRSKLIRDRIISSIDSSIIN